MTWQGNNLTRNEFTQSYDDRGRLSTSTNGGATTTYVYNALGQRVSKSSTNSSTHFLFSQEGQLLVEVGENITREYIYLNGQPLAVWHLSDTGTASTQISVRVSAGKDDAEEAADGKVRRGKNNVRLVERSNIPGTVGIRFKEVAVPPGAEITSAHIQFHARRSNSDEAKFIIQAEAAGNATSIKKEDFNISSRPRTSASVTWLPEPWVATEAGDAQRTPDLSDLIQEVVNLPDWESGNKMLLIVSGEGLRRAFSYNSDPALAAELVD